MEEPAQSELTTFIICILVPSLGRSANLSYEVEGPDLTVAVVVATYQPVGNRLDDGAKVGVANSGWFKAGAWVATGTDVTIP